MNARHVRSGFFLLSATCFVAWLAPLGATSRALEMPLSLGRLPAIPVMTARLPPIVVVRDPFSKEPQPATRVDESFGASRASGDPPDAFSFAKESSNDAGAFDPSSSVLDIGGPMPSDDAASHGLSLKATIVGRRAVAYVQDGAMLDIVRVGDRLGAKTIAHIELSGLVFDDGTRLDLNAGYHAPPVAAAATPAARALTIEDLRRALAAARSASPASVPTGSRAATAVADPTPGPLPTVDADGREPGTAPTSDPRAATPYPVPGIDR